MGAVWEFNHFIKNPQTTIALPFLTHNISATGGVPQNSDKISQLLDPPWSLVQFLSENVFQSQNKLKIVEIRLVVDVPSNQIVSEQSSYILKRPQIFNWWNLQVDFLFTY